MALRLARWLRAYNYSERAFFSTDSAPPEIADQRRAGFERLARLFQERFPKTIASSRELEASISDLAFVNSHRVPFQYQEYVRNQLQIGSVVEEAEGPRVRDLDGNWSYDLS